MDSLPIHPLDIVVLVIIFVSALFAFFRGLMREILSTLVWIIAALITAFAFPFTNSILKSYIAFPYLPEFIAILGVFLILVIILSLIALRFGDVLDNMGLGALDKALGALFGFVRGALFVGIVWFFFIAFVNLWGGPQERAAALSGSRLYPYLESSSPWIYSTGKGLLSTFLGIKPTEEMDSDINKTLGLSDWGNTDLNNLLLIN